MSFETNKGTYFSANTNVTRGETSQGVGSFVGNIIGNFSSEIQILSDGSKTISESRDEAMKIIGESSSNLIHLLKINEEKDSNKRPGKDYINSVVKDVQASLEARIKSSEQGNQFHHTTKPHIEGYLWALLKELARSLGSDIQIQIPPQVARGQ